MATKVAVVTGSNKGIGFAIVRALCKEFSGDVYLTARNPELGEASVKEFEKDGLHPKFHQLDICDRGSVERLRDFLKDKYQGLDVLVNNAAIMWPKDSPVPFSEQAEKTLHTNFFCTVDACEVLFPLLRAHSRVCNISSGAAIWALDGVSQTVRDRFQSPDITMEELTGIMKAFVKAAANGTVVDEGLYENAYAMSKAGVNVMTAIQQRDMDKTGAEDILINCCTPGYVATDMTSYKGPLTIEEGAVTPTYVALLPPNTEGIRGKFLRDKKISDH